MSRPVQGEQVDVKATDQTRRRGSRVELSPFDWVTGQLEAVDVVDGRFGPYPLVTLYVWDGALGGERAEAGTFVVVPLRMTTGRRAVDEMRPPLERGDIVSIRHNGSGVSAAGRPYAVVQVRRETLDDAYRNRIRRLPVEMRRRRTAERRRLTAQAREYAEMEKAARRRWREADRAADREARRREQRELSPYAELDSDDEVMGP